MRTFGGSAERKARTLALFDGGDQVAMVDPAANSDTVAAFADAISLPVSLVLLLRGIALTNFDVRGRAALGRTLVDTVPVGVDAATVAERWVGWSLLDDAVGPLVIIEDPDALALTREIAARHEQADRVETAAGEWRRLRNAAVAMRDARPQGSERSAIGTVANSCWNFDRMPGTVSDCFNGWIDMQAARTYAAEGFSLEELNLFADRNYDAWTEAGKRLDGKPDRTNAEVHALTRDILIETHPEIGVRGYHVMDRRDVFVADAIAAGRRKLESLLTTTEPAVAPS